MLNLSSNLAELIISDFDPNVLDVAVSYFAVAAKYAGLFGILGYLVKMLTKAFSGKERFI